MFCCAPPMPMRGKDCWTSHGWATCWPACGTGSSPGGWSGFRPWRSRCCWKFPGKWLRARLTTLSCGRAKMPWCGMRCVSTDSGVDPKIGDFLIDLNGERLLLDSCGAAFIPAHRTLVVADLHFEKGSAYARSRQFLPPYDTADTLLRVSRAVARHRPERIIALGDTFHDGGAGDRMGEVERALLAAIPTEWIWIAGNHDPTPPPWAAGMVAQEYRLGGLIFRHEPRMMFQRGEVAGHFHPCAAV